MISALGLNHKTATLDERGLFASALSREWIQEWMKRSGATEAVALSTCNRFEIYAFMPMRESSLSFRSVLALREREQKQALAELNGSDGEKRFYWYAGSEAAAHLFRVTSALDSLVIGEAQISGQVKDALTQAIEWNIAGPMLERLFQHAFSVSKQVRTKTKVGRYPISAATIALQLASSIFGEISTKSVLLIGAGSLSELLVKNLLKKGVSNITIANRTFERGEELAQRYDLRAVSLSEISSEFGNADLVMSAVQCDGGMLWDRAFFEGVQGRDPLVVLDLSVPRSINPDVRKLPGLHFYELDDLKEISNRHLSLRKRELKRAEEMITEEVHKYRNGSLIGEKGMLIHSLKDKLEMIREEICDQFVHKFSFTSERDKALLQQMTTLLVNRIAHNPIAYLKKRGNSSDSELKASVIEQMFDLNSYVP